MMIQHQDEVTFLINNTIPIIKVIYVTPEVIYAVSYLKCIIKLFFYIYLLS